MAIPVWSSHAFDLNFDAEADNDDDDDDNFIKP
jgi:hypothetical protein